MKQIPTNARYISKNLFPKLLIALTFLLMGCGTLSRGCAKYFGSDEVCIDGVKYIQFTSGASVKYNPDGTIATCK
jgi:hypothetical protein